MTAGTVVTRARVEGLVIVAAALAYLWQAHQISDLYQMPGVPGPTAFPTLVGIVFGLGGLWRLLARTRRTADGGAEADAPADPAATGWLARHGRFYAMWAVLLAYMATMPGLGFPLATAVALALLFRLLGERRWPLIAGLSVLATAVIYVAFAWGLAVQLPRGVLDGAFKALAP